ncbi:hypothetical protein C8Q73DRAFT_655523 [Cubamyces lactineus]|nr:hypothetical protein C8Q73DRAFT_655523 [Cubamyces lactineus]
MRSSTELLHSPNIASAICRHLSAGPLLPEDEYTVYKSDALKERRKHQRDLSRLARVCRTVSGIALDDLWRSIDDFTHILYAFDAYDRKKCMFTEALSDADKTKFNAYARRVRELHVGKIERVHATVWVVLVAHWGPRGPLLPGLERMTGLEIDSNSLCYTMIFSPTIKHLSLEVNGRAEPGIVRMVVDAAKPVLTSLVHLSITSFSSSSAIPFWELNQLHRLQVSPPVTLTRAIIRSLASFPHLNQLELKIESIPTVGDDEDHIQGFSSLRTLSLKGSLDNICAFMIATKPPSLESLNIMTNRLCPTDGGSGSSIERLQGTLPSSLHTFSATLTCEVEHQYGRSCEHFPDNQTLFAPLLALKNLQRISIAVDTRSFRLTDATLANVTHTWPQLVQFKVTTPQPEFSGVDYEHPVISSAHSIRFVPPPQPKHPSVKTIAIFAHAHPKLEQLVLPTIDLDAVPELDSVPLLEHGLRHFSVCCLTAGVGLMYHARALDMLFPRLDLGDAYKLSATRWRQDATDRNTELQLLLLALQAGRTSEPGRRERAAREGPTSVDPHAIRLLRPEGVEQSAEDEDDSGLSTDAEDAQIVSSRDYWTVAVPPPNIPFPISSISQPPPQPRRWSNVSSRSGSPELPPGRTVIPPSRTVIPPGRTVIPPPTGGVIHRPY